MNPILMILCFDLLVEDYIALEAKYRRALERRAKREHDIERAIERLTDDVITLL